MTLSLVDVLDKLRDARNTITAGGLDALEHVSLVLGKLQEATDEAKKWLEELASSTKKQLPSDTSDPDNTPKKRGRKKADEAEEASSGFSEEQEQEIAQLEEFQDEMHLAVSKAPAAILMLRKKKSSPKTNLPVALEVGLNRLVAGVTDRILDQIDDHRS